MPSVTGPSPSPSPSNVNVTVNANGNGANVGGNVPGTTPATPTTPAPVVSDGFELAASIKQKRAAEKALGVIGHKPGPADGRITDATRAALRTFQRARGLAQTGELDRKTYVALRGVEKQTKKGVQTAGLLSQGTRVVEQRLRRLGYDVGAADGLFTYKTAEAVKAFKQDQKLEQNGAMGQRAREILKGEIGALAHKPYRSRVKNTAEHQRADRVVEAAVTATNATGGPSRSAAIGVGDRGPAVATIQRHLRSAGFDPKSTRGVFDERTAGMVREFQSGSGLEPSGKVGFGTWKKLRNAQMEAKSGKAFATSPTQDIGERSGAVKKTEQMLKKLGFNPGAVDGTYDSRTQRALDRFRKTHHVGGRGQGVGPATLAKLSAATKGTVSAGQLTRIMPGLDAARARKVAPFLNQAMVEFGITTKKRQAAFLAQIGHESVSLRYFEEIASGSAYEGRADLGNTRPGDGVRYKGRGPIQLTGRANYRNVGNALGLPLEAKPKMAARLSVGFRTAGYFWQSRGLNGLADQGAFDAISIRINGGENGLQDRRDRHARARAVLGV